MAGPKPIAVTWEPWGSERDGENQRWEASYPAWTPGPPTPRLFLTVHVPGRRGHPELWQWKVVGSPTRGAQSCPAKGEADSLEEAEAAAEAWISSRVGRAYMVVLKAGVI